MRHVCKDKEPPSLIAWKALACANWQPSFRVLQNPEKSDLLAALISEQHDTCCYCGMKIDQRSSHIEHFDPQSANSSDALSYSNMFASCLRDTDKGQPLRCGKLKGMWFDKDTLLSPLDESCEQQFNYTYDGQIQATSARAKQMIKVLGLDQIFIESRRAAALAGALPFDAFLLTTNEDLRKLADGFREPDSNGSLVAYFHVIARYIESQITLSD